MAAPIVSIADHVTDEIAFAATSSRSSTTEGIAAVLAGSKNVESPELKDRQHVNEPQLISTTNKQKAQYHESTQQVRPDHDLLAAEPVGNHTGNGSEEKARNEARDEKKTDVTTRAGKLKDDRVEGDGIEPVAHLTDDLAEPQLPETAIPA